MIKIQIKQTINSMVAMTEEEYEEFKKLESDYEKFDFIEWNRLVWDKDKDSYKFNILEDND